jgi:hypothetical protein
MEVLSTGFIGSKLQEGQVASPPCVHLPSPLAAWPENLASSIMTKLQFGLQ